MTQREITVRLCEAYIKAGKTVDLKDVIKIADYIMVHTNEYAPYYTYTSSNLTNQSDPCLYTSTASISSDVVTISDAANKIQDDITL